MDFCVRTKVEIPHSFFMWLHNHLKTIYCIIYLFPTDRQCHLNHILHFKCLGSISGLFDSLDQIAYACASVPCILLF